MEREQLVRLVAECFAVIDREQIELIATSMDLSVPEVNTLFAQNEEEWERIKDQL